MKGHVDHWHLLREAIPNDHSRQVNSHYYLEQVCGDVESGGLLLDLGCGSGTSLELVIGRRPDLRWVGVDVPGSPEQQVADAPSSGMVLYDGVRLPFADGSIDVVYSHQVLEHVLEPLELLREVCRVLTPSGRFIGSTSQMEPYHSLSVWNYTTYGFRLLVERAGMALVEIRPSIDAITLVERALEGRDPSYDRYFTTDTSPLNERWQRWGRKTGRRPALVNNAMLQYCGQFCFLVGKANG